MLQREVRFEADVLKRVSLRHLLYLPPRYHQRPCLRWPLMLFLHGAGERGDDLDLVRKHGPPKLVEERPLPFVILSPQCPEGTTWSTMLGGLAALVEDALGRYRVDPARVYVTGLSMGGFGTWALAAARPDLVAAIAPICGGGDWFHGFPMQVLRLWEMPVWAFHGAQDQVVPPSRSRELIELLQALGGPARLTIHPDADHDSWTTTYNDTSLYRWFLAQRLGPRRLPRARQATSLSSVAFRYWHALGAGCVIAHQMGGMPRLVPITREAWDALQQGPTTVAALESRLEELGLPADLAPYVAAVLGAEREAPHAG